MCLNHTLLKALSTKIISRLWRDTDYYLDFLKTSARLYKYGFADQVLIHAHRPDAVACAEYDTWSNNGINRYIKRGAQGIPLIANVKNGRQSIRYVFDFSDTGARDERSKEPYFWEISPKNQNAVLNTLGTSSDKIADGGFTDLSAGVGAAAAAGDRAVRDNAAELSKEIP